MAAVAVPSSLLYSVGVPVAVAVLTAALTLLINRLGASADRRRDHYAQAVQTLVAWIEFPYRVRRRTDDGADTLHALAGLGHDLQERLACHQAWIAAEKPATAQKYAEVRQEVGALVGPAIREAWTLPPVTKPADMNLSGWGPAKECEPFVASLQHQIERRFGLRRLTKP
jgi:hypothetical protein